MLEQIYEMQMSMYKQTLDQLKKQKSVLGFYAVLIYIVSVQITMPIIVYAMKFYSRNGILY